MREQVRVCVYIPFSYYDYVETLCTYLYSNTRISMDINMIRYVYIMCTQYEYEYIGYGYENSESTQQSMRVCVLLCAYINQAYDVWESRGVDDLQEGYFEW